MKLPGFCLKCRRPRTVNVTVPPNGVPVGICDDCQDAQDKGGRRGR